MPTTKGLVNPLTGEPAQTRTKAQIKSAENLKKQKFKQVAGRLAVEAALATLGPGAPAEKVEAIGAILVGPEDGKGLVINTERSLKQLIRKAREKFAENAGLYVDMHRGAVSAALETGEFETAIKAAQWAMENLGEDEERIIQKPMERTAEGPRVLIGVQVGGMKQV